MTRLILFVFFMGFSLISGFAQDEPKFTLPELKYGFEALEPHIDAALTFFYTGLLMTILFSAYVFTRQNEKFPKWLAIPGLISFVSFFAFLLLSLILFVECKCIM